MRGTVETPGYIPTATFQLQCSWFWEPHHIAPTSQGTPRESSATPVRERAVAWCLADCTTSTSPEVLKLSQQNPGPSMGHQSQTEPLEPSWGHIPVGTLDKGGFFFPLCISFPFLFSSFSNPPLPRLLSSLPSTLLGESSLNPRASGIPGVMNSGDEFLFHAQGLCLPRRLPGTPTAPASGLCILPGQPFLNSRARALPGCRADHPLQPRAPHESPRLTCELRGQEEPEPRLHLGTPGTPGPSGTLLRPSRLAAGGERGGAGQLGWVVGGGTGRTGPGGVGEGVRCELGKVSALILPHFKGLACVSKEPARTPCFPVKRRQRCPAPSNCTRVIAPCPGRVMTPCDS